MHPTHSNLSEICKTATIILLEDKEIMEYDVTYFEVEPPDLMGFFPTDSVVHTYLIYWPGGLVAYLVSKLAINHLQPSYIEAAHATAKQLKPFSPFKKGGW